MITALDTNVLLDLFLADPTFGEAAKRAIKTARQDGRMVICEIVYAELSPLHTTQESLDEKLRILGILLEPAGRDACFMAGHIFLRYRRRRTGRPRILPGFLIGAHALHHADALLTRDRGFYRGYFKELRIIDPVNDRATGE
jgi:predicted nucleic acid-binding protein